MSASIATDITYSFATSGVMTVCVNSSDRSEATADPRAGTDAAACVVSLADGETSTQVAQTYSQLAATINANSTTDAQKAAAFTAAELISDVRNFQVGMAAADTTQVNFWNSISHSAFAKQVGDVERGELAAGNAYTASLGGREFDASGYRAATESYVDSLNGVGQSIAEGLSAVSSIAGTIGEAEFKQDVGIGSPLMSIADIAKALPSTLQAANNTASDGSAASDAGHASSADVAVRVSSGRTVASSLDAQIAAMLRNSFSQDESGVQLASVSILI